MSRKLTALIVGLFASLALAAGTMQGCGGGSSSGDNVTLCQQGCDKALACAPDAGPDLQQYAVQCKQLCATTHCSNEAELASALRSCLQLACDAYQNCDRPACQITTGTGGATGGNGGNGGTMGGGGTGGSGGWTCEEDPQAMGCACANGPGGSLTACPTTYNCCFTFATQGQQGCACSNLAAADCTTAATTLGGTKVAKCPP